MPLEGYSQFQYSFCFSFFEKTVTRVTLRKNQNTENLTKMLSQEVKIQYRKGCSQCPWNCNNSEEVRT